MKELDELIHAYFDDALSAEEESVLNEKIKSDPAAAQRFAELSVLHNALHEGFESGSLAQIHREEVVGNVVQFPVNFSKLVPWVISAAAVVLALVAFKGSSPTESGGEVVESEDEWHDSGFAVLTREVDSVWDSVEVPRQGNLLAAGGYSLKSGLAQLEFLSGVSVVIEENTAFEILSPDEMRVTRGKLRAHVPPHAIGFQIHTPQGRVLDLGTEFALDFSEERSEIHVLDGEVEWYPEGEEKTLLTAGKGLRLKDDEEAEIAAEAWRFTTSGQLEAQLATHQGERLAKWRAHGRRLMEREDLVVHFPMADAGAVGRRLHAVQDGFEPGAIVAAERVVGRWPGKSALDFSPNGSRVRVNIPGEFESLSYSTWVRIDSLDRMYNALFLTDSYEEGEPHWQITSDGRMFFSVRLGDGNKHHIYRSPVIWDHSMGKQWLHLVTTVNGATQSVSHFVNGEEVSREEVPEGKDLPLIRIGGAQIGNWGLPTKDEPEFAVRNLNGRLDEFSIYSTALSVADVQALYEAGKP